MAGPLLPRESEVGKNNYGVHAEAPKRLHGNFHCQVRRLQTFQKRMFRGGFAVFGQVAPRCRIIIRAGAEPVRIVRREETAPAGNAWASFVITLP